MASTFFGLTISYTGLQAANTAINVTAHNISNLNTEGYTRESAKTQAGNALRTYASYGTIGAGVEVTDIAQTRDTYYDVKYRNNQTNYGEYETKNSYMSQVQDFLNEIALDGTSAAYDDFFAALEQVDMMPENDSVKNQFINNALSMTDYFNTLATNLRNVQIDANNEVKDAVQQINELATNIASLNKQINQIEACFGNANDLRDQRNALVDKLSTIVNINTNEEDMGNGLVRYSVYMDGQPLVLGYDSCELQTVSRDEPRNASDAGGLYEIQWSSGQPVNIYSTSLGGRLKALVDIRDGCNGETEIPALNPDGTNKTDDDGYMLLETVVNTSGKDTSYKGIPYYQSQLNQFVSTFAAAINGIIEKGYTSDSENAGIPLFTLKNNTVAISATNISVSDKLVKNASLLATKYKNNEGEAQNDLIDDLLDIRTKTIFDGGSGTYFLETIVTDMSIDASKAEQFEANYKNLQTTIQNQRLSVMGVDTDEEAMDLIKFQQAYNLNSKMMSIMNQIYDKLINETGV